jgi:hypothetical protein
LSPPTNDKRRHAMHIFEAYKNGNLVSSLKIGMVTDVYKNG